MLQSVSSVFIVYRCKTLTGSPDPTHANGKNKPCTFYGIKILDYYWRIPRHPNSNSKAEEIHGKTMFPTAPPADVRPNARGRYLEKCTEITTMADLYTSPEPRPKN